MIIDYGVFEVLVGNLLLIGPDVRVMKWSVGWLVIWNLTADVVALDEDINMLSEFKDEV